MLKIFLDICNRFGVICRHGFFSRGDDRPRLHFLQSLQDDALAGFWIEEPYRESRTFILDGVGPVVFEKTRRARRISLTVRASRGVRVAVPWRVSYDEARSVAVAKLSWIRRTLAHVERARRRCNCR